MKLYLHGWFDTDVYDRRKLFPQLRSIFSKEWITEVLHIPFGRAGVRYLDLMSTFTSTNPYTLESNGTFTRHTNEELDVFIASAHEAYLSWKQTSFAERQKLFLAFADVMDEKHEMLAELETREMWRLYHAAKKGIKGTANLIRRNANNAERFLGDEQRWQTSWQGIPRSTSTHPTAHSQDKR